MKCLYFLKEENTLIFYGPSKLFAALFRQLTFLFSPNFVSRLNRKKVPLSSLLMGNLDISFSFSKFLKVAPPLAILIGLMASMGFNF